MDDLYFCPDCAGEHCEPLEATLGHVARCLDCMLSFERERQLIGESEEIEIHIAA